jgi:hypothetical protein
MTDEPSSPACYASEADDAYMGFAPRDELVVRLNELLEAERAGARVAIASDEGLSGPAHAALLKTVRDDELRWCAMLFRQVKRLGGEPSLKCGAFYGKAMAIEAPADRLRFLNRGQAWVVRKLEELLPRVRDDELHADLREMLDSHQVNISQTNEFLDKNAPSAP